MSNTHLQKKIILGKKEDRRILAGHPWVFSNEVREVIGEPGIGDIVELFSAGGLSLGIGFYNPHSLIAFRLLSTVVEEIDQTFFHKRLSTSVELRKRLYPQGNAFRLVHGEADYLPGLVIDKFGDYFSLQTFSYGMDQQVPIICDVLESLFAPKGIIERNESPLRTLDGLEQKKGVLRGTAGIPEISEGGLTFRVDLLEGQKTGFFLDQRENRLAVKRYSPAMKVLDCFSNDGGFALHCASAGASVVIGIDDSTDAVRRASTNAQLNQLENVRFEKADVFKKLQEFATLNETFDLIILDPPSFTKSKKNVVTAKKGYRELNAAAIRLLNKNGILVSASCSHHITSDVFLDIVNGAARDFGRDPQLLEWREAAPDHPTVPGVPETRYLKLGILRLLSR